MKKTVLLVTSSDETQDLIQLMLDSLELYEETYPRVKAFMDATLKRRSSVEAALKDLGQRDKQGECDPVLIVLDAFVRDSNEVTPPDGTAASRLLTWLEKEKPEVPVLLSSPTSVERLDLKVLGRRDVGLWSLTPANTADHPLRFAETVAGLLPPYQPQQRRITVEVGVSSARYRIRDAHYEFNTDWVPYGRPKMLQFLVSASEKFSPYGPDRTKRGDWQDVLIDYGNRLFDLLLNDTLGPAVLKLIREVQISENNPSYDVDLRFDIDLTQNESESEPLFTLPFEVVNHDFEADSFLCARVPMARRLNLVNPHQRRKLDEFTLHELMRNRKLKVLFLDASASGNVELIDETGGTIVPLQRLDELSNTEKEKEVLETFARTTASTLMEMPDVIDGRAMRATDLIDRMRDKLINGGFDIFHYSGHSISLGKGGTFLIFPDGPNRARAISVRAVADWVSKGSCRLVVLSSCRGASLRTAIEVMKAGAEAVLGFRWDVDDGACVDYFRSFYAAYLGEGRSFSSAYCEACREVQTLAHGTPIWASAVAVVRD